MVTPGWVDVHTHYDGQAMWDPLLAPSCWHGVTTVMFGNCGVGFAPVKKEHRGALMDLMEGVEEIPNPVLAAGLSWEWESFPQFMNELERRPRAIDIAAQIAHLPLRVYVMGDRAVRRERANADDIAAMRRLTLEALHSGAFGFTTSRTDSHKTPDGELVPSRDADADELIGIGSALGAAGMGAFGMNSDFDDEDYELAWMTKVARATAPGRFLLTDRYEDPQRWQRLLKATHEARAQGLSFTAQIAGRPIGVMMGIGTALNPFTVRPSYKALERLPIEEQRRRLRDRNAAEDSRRSAVRRRGVKARAIPPGGDAQMGPLLHHGQSAGLRAGAGEERRRDCRRHRTSARRGGVRLHHRRRRPVSVFPSGELRHGRSRADPHHAQRSGVSSGLERRRRALHLDRRCRRADFHADALGPR